MPSPRSDSPSHPASPPPGPSRPLSEAAAVEHNPASWIDAWARALGDRAAVVFEGRESSWSAFEKRVGALAAAFRERGIGAGDRVAIHLANHPAYLDAVFAAARIGAISLPINLRLTATELAFILGDASPRLVLTDREHEAALRDAVSRAGVDTRLWCIPDGFEDWEAELEPDSPSPAIAAVSPDEGMMIMYSSGTTGTPKGAVLPHRKTLFNALNAQGAFGITPADRCLVVAPLFHSLGLHILSIPLLYGGGTLVLHRRFEAQAVLAAIERDHISYMGGVPTHYERLLEALAARADGGRDLSSLRFLFGAGAAIEPATVRAFAEHGVVLKQGYGQTETSMLCCLDEADALRKAGSVGRALEHVTLRIIDRETLALPVAQWRDVVGPEAIGEIVVRGPITMLGYWQNEAASRETLRDGWVLTGDLGRMDAEGFVTLTGRSKEMFISGGENVYPAEIEAAYVAHPAIKEVAVVGVPDERWGEVGHAFVVLETGQEIDLEALRRFGEERLARFKIPHGFHIVDALPRTGSGKIQKFKLRASA